MARSTHLIMYGNIDTSRHAQDAQRRKRALPVETKMPKGTCEPAVPTMMSLTLLHFSIITVQMVAPMSSASAPMIANAVDSRNRNVCFRKPLRNMSQQANGRGLLRNVRDEGQRGCYSADEDEVVRPICEVAQVVRVHECSLRDDRVCELRVVREHVGRGDHEGLEPIRGGDIRADSVRAIDVATVGI